MFFPSGAFRYWQVVKEVHGVGQPRHEGRLSIDNHR